MVVSSYMNVVDYCEPHTPKVHHGELPPIPERSFSLVTQEVTPRLPFDVTTCSLTAPFSDHIYRRLSTAVLKTTNH